MSTPLTNQTRKLIEQYLKETGASESAEVVIRVEDFLAWIEGYENEDGGGGDENGAAPASDSEDLLHDGTVTMKATPGGEVIYKLEMHGRTVFSHTFRTAADTLESQEFEYKGSRYFLTYFNLRKF